LNPASAKLLRSVNSLIEDFFNGADSAVLAEAQALIAERIGVTNEQ